MEALRWSSTDVKQWDSVSGLSLWTKVALILKCSNGQLKMETIDFRLKKQIGQSNIANVFLDRSNVYNLLLRIILN